MAPLSIAIDDIIERGSVFHVSRAVLARTRPKRLHVQDYHELFWLVNGKARLHLDEGGKMPLIEGDLTFLPPHCLHALQGVGEESHLVNVIIPPEEVKALTSRYPLTAQFFAPSDNQPVTVHRGMRALSRLSSAAVNLESAPRERLHLEAFLLPMLSELSREQRNMPPEAPDWLTKALIAAEEPDVFRDGAAGLVAQCGRAHAHVARTMQAHLGMTPSDYVNGCRMTYAARQLSGTVDTLVEIAETIGITNMSHFHRLFRARFSVTPRQYRVKYQKGVIQPD